MDELKFRREAYENPNRQDDEFLASMHESSERTAFVNDLKLLDKKLEAAQIGRAHV